MSERGTWTRPARLGAASAVTRWSQTDPYGVGWGGVICVEYDMKAMMKARDDSRAHIPVTGPTTIMAVRVWCTLEGRANIIAPNTRLS